MRRMMKGRAVPGAKRYAAESVTEPEMACDCDNSGVYSSKRLSEKND